MGASNGPSAGSRLLRRVGRVRRRILWHRRLLAAVAAGVAAYVAVQAAGAPPPPTVPVWTAAHDLRSGAVLGRDDLVQQRFTPQSVPADHLRDVDAVVGRTVASPIGAGSAVTTDDLIGATWLSGRGPGPSTGPSTGSGGTGEAAGAGLSAVPVRITDPAVVPLLRVGDTVGLVAADPQHPTDAEVLTETATVLALPRSSDDTGGNLQGRLVVVGIPTQIAAEIAGASVDRFLTVVWNR